jgi:hypothetical protein
VPQSRDFPFPSGSGEIYGGLECLWHDSNAVFREANGQLWRSGDPVGFAFGNGREESNAYGILMGDQ